MSECYGGGLIVAGNGASKVITGQANRGLMKHGNFPCLKAQLTHWSRQIGGQKWTQTKDYT